MAIGVLLARVLRPFGEPGDLLIASLRHREGAFDRRGRFRQRIEEELDRRGQANAQRLADLGTDDALRGFEGASRGLAILIIPEHGVEDRRVLKIARHTHIRDRDETQARILDPPTEHTGDGLLDPVLNLASTRFVRHVSSWIAVAPGSKFRTPMVRARAEVFILRFPRTGPARAIGRAGASAPRSFRAVTDRTPAVFGSPALGSLGPRAPPQGRPDLHRQRLGPRYSPAGPALATTRTPPRPALPFICDNSDPTAPLSSPP